MTVRKTNDWLGVFFCSLGSVCAVSAMQATAQSVESQADPIELFDESQDDSLPNGQTVNVGSFGEIDLHVKDLDLTKVLQLLSLQSQRNIIASRNVAGTVSADLYQVDFYEALDAILATNGFGYREKSNFIYVYTADELRDLEQAEKAVVTQIHRLNYLSAADASAFASPLLSGAGSIAVSAAINAGISPSLGDNGANTFANMGTLVIRDYPENVEQIMAILQELDTRPRQVLVEATILESKLTDTNEFGVDFSVVANFDFNQFTNPLSVVDDLINGTVKGNGEVIQSNVGNTAKAGGFKLGVTNDNASVFLRALDEVTDTTVIANPKLLVLNRQRAELLVGGRLGYVSTTSTETSTTQTVEFLDVGTQLTVRPFISSDDFIRLELKPSLSSGEIKELANQVIPEETTQELTTNVIVRSAQTVVLGGLFKEDTTVSRSQVPGAGDIPLLGNAFKGVDDKTTRSEVIFLIKPTIMRDQILTDMGQSVEEDVRLAQIGAKKGLLPWSKAKMTNANLKKAYEAYEAGDVKEAKWHTDVALYLNPQNVDAMRLQQEITGQKLWFENDSILNDATELMIDNQLQEQSLQEDQAFEKQALDPTLPQAGDAITDTQDVPQSPAPVVGRADEYAPADIDFHQTADQPMEYETLTTGDGQVNVQPTTHAEVAVDHNRPSSAPVDSVSQELIDQADDAANRAFENELEAQNAPTDDEVDAWAKTFTQDDAADASTDQPQADQDVATPQEMAQVDTDSFSEARDVDAIDDPIDFDAMFEDINMPPAQVVDVAPQTDEPANIFQAIENILPGDEAVAQDPQQAPTETVTEVQTTP